MDLKYSVIIPVYQAEKTIRRCLDSLVSQSSDKSQVEIILIDDGSSDRSGKICREYAEQFSFVRYFFKENGGVSSARNAGIEVSSGEYLMFVDSDDYVSEDYFESIERELRGEDWDWVEFSIYHTDGNSVLPRIKQSFETAKQEEAISKIADLICRNGINSPCGKVYKKSIVSANSVDFTKGAFLGEDWAFNIKYAFHVHAMKIVDHPIYYVSLENEHSLSRKVVKDTSPQGQITRADVMNAFEKCDLDASNRKTIQEALNFSRYRSVYTRAKMLIRLGYDRKTRIAMLRELCRKTRKNSKGIPKTRYCCLIAAPVALGLPGVIDAAAVRMVKH